MATDRLQEAHARTVEWQAAFVQGVAASAIAFAIHETSDRKLAMSLVPIAIGLLMWAISFACGIFNNHARQSAIAANIGEIVAREGGREDLSEQAIVRFRQHSRKAGAYYLAQLWLLLAGAVLYVSGHALHIWEQTKSARSAPPVEGTPPCNKAALGRDLGHDRELSTR